MTARAPRDWLLTTLADKILAFTPNSCVTSVCVALSIHPVIWDWHGISDPTPESIADAKALRDEASNLPIQEGETCGEYAARLRLAAQEVRL